MLPWEAPQVRLRHCSYQRPSDPSLPPPSPMTEGKGLDGRPPPPTTTPLPHPLLYPHPSLILPTPSTSHPSQPSSPPALHSPQPCASPSYQLPLTVNQREQAVSSHPLLQQPSGFAHTSPSPFLSLQPHSHKTTHAATKHRSTGVSYCSWTEVSQGCHPSNIAWVLVPFGPLNASLLGCF